MVSLLCSAGWSQDRVLNFSKEIQECKCNGHTKCLLKMGDYDGMRSHVSKIDVDTATNPLKYVDKCMHSLEDILNEGKHTFISEAKLRKPLNKNKRNLYSSDKLLLKL